MPADDKSITIPMPRKTSHLLRGNFQHEPAIPTRPTTIRFTDDDRVTIDKEAHALGMSFGEFVRWCALNSAMEVGKYRVLQTFEDAKSARNKNVNLDGFE